MQTVKTKYARLLSIVTLSLIVLCLTMSCIIKAQEVGAAEAFMTAGKRIGAGLAFGLAAAGAGIGIGLAGAAAVGGMIERRELFAMYLLFIALAEAIAIYGFAMAFILMA